MTEFRGTKYDLRPQSQNDLWSLLQIIISLLLIAIAGFVSKAHSADRLASGAMDPVFVKQEIRRYESFSKSSHEYFRDSHFKRVNRILTNLDDHIADTRRKLGTYESVEASRPHDPSQPFAHEELRESLLALQDAGHEAVGYLIDVDQSRP